MSRVYLTIKCRELPIVGSSATTVLLAALFTQDTNKTWQFKQATQRHRGDRSFTFGGELCLDLPKEKQLFTSTYYQISIYHYQANQAARVTEQHRLGSIIFSLAQLLPSYNPTTPSSIAPLILQLTHDTNDSMGSDLASLHSQIIVDADWYTRAGREEAAGTATSTTQSAAVPAAVASAAAAPVKTAPAPTVAPTPTPAPASAAATAAVPASKPAPASTSAIPYPRSSTSSHASHISHASTASSHLDIADVDDETLGIRRSAAQKKKKQKKASISSMGSDDDMELDLDSDEEESSKKQTPATTTTTTAKPTTQTQTQVQPQTQPQPQPQSQSQSQSQPAATTTTATPAPAPTPATTTEHTNGDKLDDDEEAEAEAEKFSQQEYPDEDGYPELLAKIERMMMKGRVFIRHASQQAPTRQKIIYRPGIVDPNQLEISPGYLYWCSPDATFDEHLQQTLHQQRQWIDLESVTDIYLGKQTGAFNGISDINPNGEVGENEDDGVSFTLASEDTTLDLESHTAKQRAAWIFGIMGILKRTGNA